jgi:hypothetical protein
MNSFNRPRARSQEFLRTFINEYNQIIRTHTEMMSEYNINVRNILNIIQRTSEYGPTHTHTPAPTPTTTRSSSRSDIATLIYLLSQAGVDDVRVGLSQSQIENATESVLYTTEAFPEITQCPISLDEFDDGELVCQIRYCRHIFKRRNIMRWLETHTCCPVCRHDLENSNSEPVRAPSSIWSSLFNRSLDVSGNDVYTVEFPLRF